MDGLLTSAALRWVGEICRDVRLAIRSCARNPGFVLIVVVTLGVGIGANTAVFSLINAVVLEPLHVRDADRLVRSLTLTGGRLQGNSDPQTFKVWREATSIFEDVAAHRLDFMNMTDAAAPEQLAVARVSASFFDLFHAPLVLGRGFSVQEDVPHGPAVAVLSYGLWTRRFGNDASVVGRTLPLGNVSYLIVGVLGRDFDTEQFDLSPDAWVPLQADPERVDGASIYQVTARLKPGITPAIADAKLQVAYAAYAVGRDTAGERASQRNRWLAQPLRDAMIENVRAMLVILLGTVSLLLLIACGNVANLLLARAEIRQREMAIRAAIGAGRARLIQQLLIESAMLSCGGAIVGLVVGPLAIRWLLRLYQARNPFTLGVTNAVLPRIGDDASSVAIDWRVVAFTLGVSVITTVVFGLIPARTATRRELAATLQRTTSPASTRRYAGRSSLVVAEMALAMILVIGAALLVRTANATQAVDPGFKADQVLTMRMAVAGTPAETQAGITALTRRGIAELQATPGVARVSTTCCMPLETVWQLPFVIASRAGQGLQQYGNMQFHAFGGWTFVSPGYFDVFGIPIRRGRDFTEQDNASAAGVVIINEAMARRYWPDGDPIGDRLVIGRGMRAAYDQDPARQIIGIVGNVRDTGLTHEPRPAMYVPVAQLPDAVTTPNVTLLPLVWIVRTVGAPRPLANVVTKRLQSVSDGIAVTRVRSMDQVVSEATARVRFDMWLMTTFGVVALLLAAIGVYGLVTFSTEQRSKEIGIRLALGAESTRVTSMVVVQGLRLATAGIVIGLLAAFALAGVLAGLLFGVRPHDPLVFVSVPAVLMGVTLLAVWVPARRASRLDPVVALRAE